MKKLLLIGTAVLLMTASAHAQGKCPQCMGDGFPHPNYQQPVSAQHMQCLRTALARYGKSTVALDNAVRACARYR
jgi:hypothetical protein